MLHSELQPSSLQISEVHGSLSLQNGFTPPIPHSGWVHLLSQQNKLFPQTLLQLHHVPTIPELNKRQLPKPLQPEFKAHYVPHCFEFPQYIWFSELQHEYS